MNDIDIFLSDEFRCSVEANLDRDPMRIALDKKIPHAALVASQVKYLSRAATKLPSYHSARCIIPSLAFEQSSSEAVAAQKNHSGRLCIDLTCGLGVDSFHFSKSFERVVAIERDPNLAAIARENFRRLGADNIEVVNASAEDFLTGFDHAYYGGLGADLVYADPDRRNPEGKKMVRIEDCSPDVVSLLPLIDNISPHLVTKLSPLFDVDEVFRIFGTHIQVEVVSLGGECKEIVVDRGGNASAPVIRAVAIGIGEAECMSGDTCNDTCSDPERNRPEASFTPGLYKYLIIPDVSLQKARLVRRYFSGSGTTGDIYADSDNGYGFAAEHPSGYRVEPLMGRVLGIASIEPFEPKALRRRLKTAGIKNIDILKREFPLSTADIADRLGVNEGGTTKIAFTRAAGKLWQITLGRLEFDQRTNL